MSDDALQRTYDRPADVGHYGPGYGEADWQLQPMRRHPHEDDHPDAHYRRLRQEHERQLDDDYQAFRRQRFQSDFETWRSARASRAVPQPADIGRGPVAPRHEGAMQSLGRAVSETVAGTRPPDLHRLGDADGGRHEPPDDGSQREATQRFFERS